MMSQTGGSTGSRGKRARRRVCGGRVAVVDIGSNTVRLVVYDAPTRLPIPMFNEKAQCELGRGLADTGKLYEPGVERALHALARFIRLAQAMGVEELVLVATAAVRDAADGPDFVQEVKNRFGLEIEVLTGKEEAQLAALGLLSGVPDADGVLGDLGGGSFDLVEMKSGIFGRYATLPLGHLRLMEESGSKAGKAATLTEARLEKIKWLPKMKGKRLYAVGGSLRAVARIMIDQTNYPLHVIDNFEIPREEALRILRVISGLSKTSLEKIKSLSKRRIETLPYAATALRVLIERMQPKSVVFSGFGMREGRMLLTLPSKMRNQDPLIAACMGHAERSGRFSISGAEIYDWLTPLFPNEEEKQSRSRRAACYLSDIGWAEHPDYRAEHAFYRALRVPFAGLSHPARVLLAQAIYIRYNGDYESDLVNPLRGLLDDEQRERVEILGLALRLAHTVSGSAPSVLGRTSLAIEDKTLVLTLHEDPDAFDSETVTRRTKTLAKKMKLDPVITAAGKAAG